MILHAQQADQISLTTLQIGQMPWLDYIFIKNPLRRLVQGGSTGAVARFARARLDERLMHSESTAKDNRDPTQSHRDFLARFLEAKKKYPDIVTDNQVFSYTVSNMNAGSDTTAISLRAILYYTLKSPRVMAKLYEELTTAYQERRISLPVSWKQSQDELPYLDAVIKEALRLHPAVGLLLERIVPTGGLQLPNGGPFLPAGTIVGANPWIIHRHSIFGMMLNSLCRNAGCGRMGSLKPLSTRGGRTCSEQHSHLELDPGRALGRTLAC
jgi:cytochrome P450